MLRLLSPPHASRADPPAATRTRCSVCKMELKAQGAPSPKTLCALPGGRPEAWRPARAPSPASQTGKDRRAEGGAGPHEMGTARAAIPRSADCPTPAHRPLPTVHRTLWTPHPGHNRTMRPPRSRGSQVETAAEGRSPSAWGGTEHRPRPLHPPRLRAKDAFGGAANPSP